ncbi:HNH endonuclease [Saccharopolyspora shandongensis]|uniref:HNH endonuclease n=1 Tax=Saccharopolyspora shandongensis TaxID=418495 RepID=UPI00340750D9
MSGPVSLAVYQAIRNEGSCVYCGDISETVDHVRPLSRGGIEHESNLVPACMACNYSKGRKLLSEWDEGKVLCGVEASPIVAEEWASLVSETEHSSDGGTFSDHADSVVESAPVQIYLIGDAE